MDGRRYAVCRLVGDAFVKSWLITEDDILGIYDDLEDAGHACLNFRNSSEDRYGVRALLGDKGVTLLTHRECFVLNLQSRGAVAR